MLTRRRVLYGIGTAAAGGLGAGGYAFAIEPERTVVSTYRPQISSWPDALSLRIAVLADPHIGQPHLTMAHLERIVSQTNALQPDLVLLLGDFEVSHRLSQRYPKHVWTRALARLRAPLGIFAVLGNHDWWEDITLQRTRKGPTPVGLALEAAGIAVLENDAIRLVHDGRPFWLLGLGDQWAFFLDAQGRPRQSRFGFFGVDDLPATLSKLTDDAPAILMAHEPDIFPNVPSRVALTLSGHTHGGQVNMLGWTPIVPSKYGSRYAYGHVVERARDQGERHLIVSGGLGCSGLPIRFGRPPEIVIVELGGVIASA